MASDEERQPWYLQSTFPVLFPSHKALTLPEKEFKAFLATELHPATDTSDSNAGAATDEDGDTFTMVSTPPPSTTADLRDALKEVDVNISHGEQKADESHNAGAEPTHPFMQGLLSHTSDSGPDMTNKMLTENGDVAFRSTQSPLLDLFVELEEVISGPRLRELLEGAWQEDQSATVRIIFNTRSIHLGKSAQMPFYRCCGWLAQNHPITLIENLRWLVRPIIEKKAVNDSEEGGKHGGGDEDAMVIVEDETDPRRFDIKTGVSHGYWKDLLTILQLSAHGALDVLKDPKETLRSERKSPDQRATRPTKRSRVARNFRESLKGVSGGANMQLTSDPTKTPHERRDEYHDEVVRAFNEQPVHRALHIAVARLFAEQLASDLKVLRGGDEKAKRYISLCAKWAPSHNRAHDKATFIVSSIAELLHPMSEFHDVGEDRELYLRKARGAYTADMAALRKHLEIVERDLSANTLDRIEYDRVPSLAMSNYASQFASKDTDRFGEYLEKVAKGKARISGAVLLPSTLVSKARGAQSSRPLASMKSTKSMIEAKMAELEGQTLDGQWKSLVQRIKDSGSLENSIAVCDVSGSMTYPGFSDGTTPLDSAIGLSLLLAEVTAPPFGGAFITFSTNPTVQQVDLSRSLREKINALDRSHWNMTTDFVAVFERLILPIAVRNKLKQEDMVKKVFVFSDMHFNQAGSSHSWSTSFERIQKQYRDAGYEMPELVFWNLAGGRAGYSSHSIASFADPTAPKPVEAEEPGTAMVSGYSQAMLKVFLDKGSFADEDEEDEVLVETKTDADGEVEVVEKTVKKQKMDPLSVMWKAIGHRAYRMLTVVD